MGEADGDPRGSDDAREEDPGGTAPHFREGLEPPRGKRGHMSRGGRAVGDGGELQAAGTAASKSQRSGSPGRRGEVKDLVHEPLERPKWGREVGAVEGGGGTSRTEAGGGWWWGQGEAGGIRESQ